jgi:hypothetical protein
VDLVPLRRAIFRHFAETGSPPPLAAEESAALEAAHAVVLDANGAVAFANPFAVGPTPFRVDAGGASYRAICAWDALGILAALRADGTVETECPDCGDAIIVRVRNGLLAATNAVVHFLVPAARWFDPEWTPHDRERNREDLAAAGLSGPFWQLP